MKISHRYILKEHLFPFFIALFGVMLILLLDYILKILDLIVRKGVSLDVTLQVFTLNLAWMVSLAIPMAVLIATIMAFGRLSQDNEIVAFKAAGVSEYKLLTPVIIVAVFMTAGLILFNNYVLPDVNHKARMLSTDIHKKNPTVTIKEGVINDDLPGISVIARKVDYKNSTLEDITIFEEKERFPRIILAERGKMEYLSSVDAMILTLYDGEIHEIDEKDPSTYQRVEFTQQIIRMKDLGVKLEHKSSHHRGDREMTVGMMLEQIRDRQEKANAINDNVSELIKKSLQEVAEPHVDKRTDDVKATEREESEILEEVYRKNKNILTRLKAWTNSKKGIKRVIDRYLVEVHKKFSIPFACIVFILIGAPVGIMARKGGLTSGLGLSLGFFVIYWAFLIGGEELADRGFVHPAVAMWSPNILLGLLGLFFIYWTIREAHFINWSKMFAFIKKSARKLSNFKRFFKSRSER